MNFDYVLDLLQAKGWYLYEGIAHAGFPQVISAGRSRTLRLGVYYHLMPTVSHDTSVDEVRAAIAEAARTNSAPRYNDGVHQGPVIGITISDGQFALVSKENSFAFPANARATIENAIKFNLSNYNTLFFDSIDAIREFLDERGIAPQLPPILPSQLRWTYLALDDDSMTTAIWPENPGDVLFRGQVKRYFPCVSTAVRDLGIKAGLLHELSEASQARLIANFIRAEWFAGVLRGTSAVKWLRAKRVFLDEMAVAQHYGLPTGYIDLTQSFDVASFFACCRYDSRETTWLPVADGEGVVYSVFWRGVPKDHSIRPINLQFFPRPSEQWGWTCELRLGEDFDKLPFVQKFIFKHDLAASQRILAKFSHGKALFPDDPLSVLADKIMESSVLPLNVAQRISKDLIEDPQGKPGSTLTEILNLLQEVAGVKLSSDIEIPDLPRIESKLDNIWKQNRDAFFQGIGFQLVRQRKDDPAQTASER